MVAHVSNLSIWETEVGSSLSSKKSLVYAQCTRLSNDLQCDLKEKEGWKRKINLAHTFNNSSWEAETGEGSL